MTKCVPDNVVCGESLIEKERERATAMKEREVVTVVALAVVCSAASGN